MFFPAYKPTKKSRTKRRSGFISPITALDMPALPIAQTIHTAQLLHQLQDDLRQLLGQNLGAHCHISKLNHGELELSIPNVALAAKLRQLAPSMAEHLGRQGYTIHKLKIKVVANLPNTSPTIIPSNISSPQQAACHKAFADFVAQNPDSPISETMRNILKKYA